jgi:hypothetical protein
MSKTCEGCKWWMVIDEDSPIYGECLLAEGDGWHAVYPQTKAHAIYKTGSSEPIEINLMTHYDFRCNQFEANP